MLSRTLTFWLLNVAITFSAPSLLTNCSSTMTVGLEDKSLHPSVSPPIGLMTASISAAVVPGAKLLAMTVHGPPVAAPRMLMPGAASLLRAAAPRPSTGANLSYVLLLRSTCDAEAVRARLFLLLADPRGLFSLCRSCCHFPSTLPSGRPHHRLSG
jgi:hypothetical protein